MLEYAFLLTRPSRDVTPRSYYTDMAAQISTHTPLAGRDLKSLGLDDNALKISTHTPLAGRDEEKTETYILMQISTHTPLAGRDRYIL